MDWLPRVVTRNEYATLTQKVQNLASGVGVQLKLPRVPPGQLGKDAPEQGRVTRLPVSPTNPGPSSDTLILLPAVQTSIKKRDPLVRNSIHVSCAL